MRHQIEFRVKNRIDGYVRGRILAVARVAGVTERINLKTNDVWQAEKQCVSFVKSFTLKQFWKLRNRNVFAIDVSSDCLLKSHSITARTLRVVERKKGNGVT